ncbi:hypothetical protein GGR51DRAFT_573535 [Nemania sp. FL0031]|nr:hypothetical protein GGR51DRAFT_573535 [Nemania sp. FL0031]
MLPLSVRNANHGVLGSLRVTIYRILFSLTQTVDYGLRNLREDVNNILFSLPETIHDALLSLWIEVSYFLWLLPAATVHDALWPLSFTIKYESRRLVKTVSRRVRKRKAKKYFAKATCASVLTDLDEVFSSKITEHERVRIQITFDRYCIEESSQPKYWNESCFRELVREAHSPEAISDSEIRFLWRSFHFYAYHPFPLEPQDNPIVEFEAFRRATLLTAFQCDKLLGTKAFNRFRLHAPDFYHNASIERIYRSMGTPVNNAETDLSKPEDSLSSTVGDTADVLFMTCLQLGGGFLPEEQLRDLAQKFIAEGSVAERKIVELEDVSMLVDIVQRLVPDKGLTQAVTTSSEGIGTQPPIADKIATGG